jgi:protein TonB
MQIQLKSAVAAVTLEDLLFENRNKKYGAYEIRVNYEKRLARALITSVSLFLLMILVIRFFPHVREVDPPVISDEGPIIQTITPPLIEHRGTVIHAHSSANEIPVVTHSTVNTDTVAPAHTETVSTAGGNDTASAGGTIASGAGSGSGTSNGGGAIDTSTDEADTKPEEPVIPDVEPEYPGGPVAYEKYLQENIKYPKFADEPVQGNIFITFVVTETGEVTDVQLVKGVNSEMDRNALEAVRKMPRWKPGKVGRHNVKVRCSAKVKVIER